MDLERPTHPHSKRLKGSPSKHNLLGSKTRTSQDASMWLESESGGRPAGSGCATAGGLGTARGLASSRRVGNVGRLGNCGRREGASRRTIDSDQLILLLVADWPIFAFGSETCQGSIPGRLKTHQCGLKVVRAAGRQKAVAQRQAAWEQCDGWRAAGGWATAGGLVTADGWQVLDGEHSILIDFSFCSWLTH